MCMVDIDVDLIVSGCFSVCFSFFSSMWTALIKP